MYFFFFFFLEGAQQPAYLISHTLIFFHPAKTHALTVLCEIQESLLRLNIVLLDTQGTWKPLKSVSSLLSPFLTYSQRFTSVDFVAPPLDETPREWSPR